MKEIPLTGGKVAFVDDEDFPLVSKHKWYASQEGRLTQIWYAKTNIVLPSGKRSIIRMHRLLLPESNRVDHRDRNGLNNRRSNLRAASRTQNAANSGGHADRRGKYKGVTFDRVNNRWRAQLMRHGKKINIGRFKTEIAAAQAYANAVARTDGEFAAIN